MVVSHIGQKYLRRNNYILPGPTGTDGLAILNLWLAHMTDGVGGGPDVRGAGRVVTPGRVRRFGSCAYDRQAWRVGSEMPDLSAAIETTIKNRTTSAITLLRSEQQSDPRAHANSGSDWPPAKRYGILRLKSRSDEAAERPRRLEG